ncbi:MAG: LLM class flavin-dependent oxidoreductase [Planctomycetota bacterium]|jgi:predicted DNA-binding transcriptional regulator AlpA
MGKKDDIELLQSRLKELQKWTEAFWNLCENDLSPQEEPSLRQTEKDLIEYTENLLYGSKFESGLRAKRLVQYAERLKDPDIRSKRAATLFERKRKIEENRKTKVERVARLADKYGFDGALFRNSMPSDEGPLSIEAYGRLEAEITTIPKIIAAIEKPDDPYIAPAGAETLTVLQMTRKVQRGESEIRRMNKTGELPKPLMDGKLLWSNKEITLWIQTGCPDRNEWEMTKKRREAVC